MVAILALAAPFASAFWLALVTLALNILRNAGGNFLGDELTQVITNARVQKEVNKKIQRAYGDAVKALPSVSPTLVAALAAAPSLLLTPTILTILADAAFHPYDQPRQVQQLAQQFHHLAPTAPLEECRVAATLFVDKIHSAIRSVSGLQSGLLLLQGQEIISAVKRPPYANQLDRRVRDTALEIERRYHHRYVAAPHLLYALAAQADSSAAKILARYGQTPDTIEAVVRNMRQDPDCELDSNAASATAVWDNAPEIARRRYAAEVRSEHLLEAVAAIALPSDERYSEATARCLVKLGLDPVQLCTDASNVGRAVSFLQSIGGSGF